MDDDTVRTVTGTVTVPPRRQLTPWHLMVSLVRHRSARWQARALARRVGSFPERTGRSRPLRAGFPARPAAVGRWCRSRRATRVYRRRLTRDLRALGYVPVSTSPPGQLLFVAAAP